MQDIIHSERLTLRRIRLSDAVRFSKLAGDWDIVRMTGSLPFPFPEISAEVKIMMMLSQFRRGLAYPYAITEDGDQLIGVADLFRRSEDSDLELGYWVAREFWGHGYASEAAKAIMKEACETLGEKRFVAGVFSDNPASMRVLEKIGFRKTGSEGDYFCMSRLKHLESIAFAIEMNGHKAAQAIEA